MILLVFILLLIINQQGIQYWFNDFGKVSQSDLQVYFLDVGQASSTLVLLPNKYSILMDTGSGDSAENLVSELQFLLEQNDVQDIDLLILSHPDADHVGGTVMVMDAFQVNSVLRPKVYALGEEVTYNFPLSTTYTYRDAIEAIYAEPNCQVEYVANQVIVQSDKNFSATIEIFAAEKAEYGTDTNSFSPFITLSYASRTFLFTGDAPAARETELLNRLAKEGRRLSVDFLQVAHHGSKYSSYPNFLSAISPKYAFISAADSSHPSQTVLRRLKEANVQQTFVTKNDGTIGVGVQADGNFVIRLKKNFLDIPLLVILLSLIIFVLMKFIYVKKSPRFVDLRPKAGRR